jgi:hypothetical protein
VLIWKRKLIIKAVHIVQREKGKIFDFFFFFFFFFFFLNK